MDKNIAKMKEPDHNIYELSSLAYKVAVSLCIALWVLLFLDVPIHHLSTLNQISIWLVILAVVPFFVFISEKKKKGTVIPYNRKENFEFLGLYNLKDINQGNSRDILKRNEEVNYMRQILEEIIFPQVSVKQALCITGPSGCGKSIIMNFFKQAYKNEYTIFDFAGNYHELEGHMVSLFGTNIDKKISEMTSGGKVVFILDQFERFFFLSQKEQSGIQEIIKGLCRKNTGIIISLREDYLAVFLKRFDMNNLLSADERKAAVPCGILQELFSAVEKKNDMHFTAASLFRITKTEPWQDHIIKNNVAIHLDTNEYTAMEKMGATLLYGRNQNEMIFRLNGASSNASVIESKCKILFGEEDGSWFFRKHTNEPLIEQQIIFHMAEFNQKVRLHSEEELRAFIEKDSNEILAQYFDCQLAACNNYFHASRLLYLLSQARIRQLSLKTQDVENYLFPTLFSQKGHEQFMNVIQQLENIQLIRKNTEGSSLEYEIAHDFIAAGYVNYASTNMDRNVKGALDLFILEYMDDRRSTAFKEKISLRKDISEQNFYRNVSCIALAFIIITHLAQRFFLIRGRPYGLILIPMKLIFRRFLFLSQFLAEYIFTVCTTKL